jgi:flagellar basal-body rod modification protein FlgD
MNTISSAQATDEFLTLLVTQLQNQDPLEPVGQEDFVAQLAQFSTLSGIEQLNGSFESMLQQQSDLIRLQELSVGSSLIGQRVTYYDAGDLSQLQEGTVDRLSLAQGRVVLEIGQQHVPLDFVINVAAAETK